MNHSLLSAFLITSFFTGCVAPVSTVPQSQTGITVPAPLPPNLKRLENGHYEVLSDWRVRLREREFTVQKGYTSNGITAPQSVKILLGDSVQSPETWCAVFHDWCFTQPDITRFQADNYFVELMQSYKLPARKVKLMETAVKGYTIYKETR